MTDQRFETRQHVRQGADFRRAYRRRCSASDGVVIVYGCENALDCCRLGLSVSRKYGSAVERNRWKRLVREAFRLNRHRLPRGVDLIVLPKDSAEPRFEQLLESLPRLAQRAVARMQKTPPAAKPSRSDSHE